MSRIKNYIYDLYGEDADLEELQRKENIYD